MDQGPLVADQIKAGARFLAEFQKCYPLQNAFWLKQEDTGYWYLYIASDQITDNNVSAAYGEAVRVAHLLKDPWFDLMQVKAIGAETRLAKAVQDLQQRYPGRHTTRLNGSVFGGISTEEVYIYPSPIAVPA